MAPSRCAFHQTQRCEPSTPPGAISSATGVIERRRKAHDLPLQSRVLPPVMSCEQQARIEDYTRAARRARPSVDTAEWQFLSGDHVLPRLPNFVYSCYSLN